MPRHPVASCLRSGSIFLPRRRLKLRFGHLKSSFSVCFNFMPCLISRGHRYRAEAPTFEPSRCRFCIIMLIQPRNWSRTVTQSVPGWVLNIKFNRVLTFFFSLARGYNVNDFESFYIRPELLFSSIQNICAY